MDSSVLILFARTERLSLLHRVAGPLEVPEAVRSECVSAAPHQPDARVIGAALDEGLLVPIGVKARKIDSLKRRYSNLGRGEISVIAGAIEKNQKFVLLDELPARRVALLEGLEPVGSLSVIARAHGTGLLKSKADVAEALRDLIEAGLWVTSEIVEVFWEGLGGRP